MFGEDLEINIVVHFNDSSIANWFYKGWDLQHSFDFEESPQNGSSRTGKTIYYKHNEFDGYYVDTDVRQSRNHGANWQWVFCNTGTGDWTYYDTTNLQRTDTNNTYGRSFLLQSNVEEATKIITSNGSGTSGNNYINWDYLEVYVKEPKEDAISICEFLSDSRELPDYVKLYNYGELNIDVTGWMLSTTYYKRDVPIVDNYILGSYILEPHEQVTIASYGDGFYDSDGNNYVVGAADSTDELPDTIPVTNLVLRTGNMEIALLPTPTDGGRHVVE